MFIWIEFLLDLMLEFVGFIELKRYVFFIIMTTCYLEANYPSWEVKIDASFILTTKNL